jgi:hypothetical protein
MQKPEQINSDKLIGTKLNFNTASITDKDAIIYAMGIGFSIGNSNSIIDPLRE